LKSGKRNLEELSQNFRKLKMLKACLPFNQSLHDFVASVEAFILFDASS
jgi:hypothetical protein